MSYLENGNAIATEPTIDIEEIRQLTRQAHATGAQQTRQEKTEIARVLEGTAQQRADYIITGLPQTIREAALKGDFSVDPFPLRNELDQETSELVGLWCKKQGLTVHHLPVGDEDAPHSPPLYVVLHVCWPTEGPFGIRGG